MMRKQTTECSIDTVVLQETRPTTTTITVMHHPTSVTFRLLSLIQFR